MKNLFALIIILLVSFSCIQAQGIRLGIKAGTNLTKVSGQSFNAGFDLAYHVGCFLEIDVNKKWGIQPELLVSQTSGKPSTFQAIYTTTSVSSSFNSQDAIKLDYLSIPLLLRYNVGRMFTLLAGPQYSILMKKENSILQNGQSAFSSGDFAMVGGAQINLKFFRIYGRYNIGLSNINDIDSKDKWTNQQIQLGVGLRF